MAEKPQSISDLLNALEETSTKTAGAAPAAPANLDAAIAATISEADTAVKTAAAAGAPVPELLKMAQEIAAVDDEVMIKRAARMGAAFVDGMTQRLTAVEAATKEAEKRAAAERAEEIRGYNEGVEFVHKLASAHFAIGCQQIEAVLGQNAGA